MKKYTNLFTKLAFFAIFFTTSLSADIVSAVTPVVALDDSGNGVAIWQAIDRIDEIDWFVIRGATASEGNWSSTATLSSNSVQSYLNNPQPAQNLAVNSAGDAVAAWSSADVLDNSIYAVQYNSLIGEWGTATQISTFTENPIFYDTTVALDDAGNITILWTTLLDNNPVLRVVRGVIGGEWSGVITLDPPLAP